MKTTIETNQQTEVTKQLWVEPQIVIMPSAEITLGSNVSGNDGTTQLS